MPAKCRSCKRELPDNALFCPWCGQKQLKERKKDGAIKVPEPKQLPSGQWHIYLRAEHQPITEATKDLCITKAKAFRAGFVEEKKSLPGITWSQAIDKFILDRSESLSPETIRGYRIIQRNRFQNIMQSPVSTDVNWQREVNALLAQYSDKTAKNSWGLMSAVMKANKISPPSILFPQKISRKREFLDPQEIIQFCGAIRGDSCEIAMLLGLHGLRMSEIKALRMPESFDFEHNFIFVFGAVVRDENNKAVFKKRNKTETSQRTVPIMIPRLKELLVAQQGKAGAVVPQRPSTINKHIHAVAAQEGLPPITEHCLRHSFASLGYHLRLSETEVMEIGGWSNNLVVHSIYLHLAKKDRLKSENKMARFYRTAEKLMSSAPAEPDCKS